MTTEEAAKDPKRKPKKQRANHAQSGKASEPTTGKPEAEPLPASKTATERQKAPRMKENPHTIPKAHSGPQMQPERATDPQPASIQSGNGARTAENPKRKQEERPQTQNDATQAPQRAETTESQ